MADQVVADPVVEYKADKPARKFPEKTRKISPNHVAYNALIDEGVKPTEACRILGISTTTAHRARAMRNVWNTQKDSLLRDSVKAVKKLVRGEAFGSIDKVKDSTALAAAGMILDREVPKVNLSQSINVNLDFLPIDLEDYR